MTVSSPRSLEFREAPLQDLWSRAYFDRPVPPELEQFRNWQCVRGSEIVGHCTGNTNTGEITGLAVVPGYQRHGVGRKLLSLVVEALRATGTTRIWLAAPSASHACHFYRAMG